MEYQGRIFRRLVVDQTSFGLNLRRREQKKKRKKGKGRKK